MLLKTLHKVLQMVWFGIVWYSKWYGTRLTIPFIPYTFRYGIMVLLVGWYTKSRQLLCLS